eukprot:756553-Hanusia_phi.AAC.2
MSYSASESRVREELSALQAAGDELSQKAALALQTLLDDLAQAHADAASASLNNEQRFHQLEQETITARCEAEASMKLKDEAVKQKQQLQDQVAALNHEISSMQKKITDTNSELQRVNAQLQEVKRDKDELIWTHERRSQARFLLETCHRGREGKGRSKPAAEEEFGASAREATAAPPNRRNSFQSELNSALTKLKHAESELSFVSNNLSEKTHELSKLTSESHTKISRLERELAAEKTEVARLNTVAEEWKRSCKEQEEAYRNQIEKVQSITQEFNATKALLESDLDNKNKLLSLAKNAQEDSDKEITKLQTMNTTHLHRVRMAEEALAKEKSEAASKIEELENRLKEAEKTRTEYQAKVNELRSVGQSVINRGEGNCELLEKILTSSPAAVASEFVREGRVAEIYKVLEDTCELLHRERHERVQAEACLSEVVKELQDKGPAILRQRQEWESAVQVTNHKLEVALGELQEMKAVMETLRLQVSSCRDKIMVRFNNGFP